MTRPKTPLAYAVEAEGQFKAAAQQGQTLAKWYLDKVPTSAWSVQVDDLLQAAVTLLRTAAELQTVMVQKIEKQEED